MIEVPRAERTYRPVYIDGNPLNTFRRNGEGDYRCSKEEYQLLVRDAAIKTQDMLLLEEMDLSVFNLESVNSYRQRFHLSRPGHVWDSLENEEFLQKVGCIGIGSDGRRHPTAAGLLMFGNEYDIIREYNNYFLDYREELLPYNRWSDRIISSSGDWSGNVYDFFFRVYNRIQLEIKIPFKLHGIVRVDDTPVHQAIREALANCLVNADYYGRQGVVILKKAQQIEMSNPGGFRIDLEIAKSGGVSDPRNGIILKLFNFIDIGERAGSGIPNIFHVWESEKWSEPTISHPSRDRTTIVLPVLYDCLKRSENEGPASSAEQVINEITSDKIGPEQAINDVTSDKTSAEQAINDAASDKIGPEQAINDVTSDKTDAEQAINDAASDKTSAEQAINDAHKPIRVPLEAVKANILAAMEAGVDYSTAEIASIIGLSRSRTRAILGQMTDCLEPLGTGNRDRTYRKRK